MRLNAAGREVFVQLGQLILDQSLQLVETKVKDLESGFIEITEPIVVHKRYQNTERVLLRHLKMCV